MQIKKILRLLSIVLTIATLMNLFVFQADTLSYVTVRVNYCYVDGTHAHDPYIATFTAGESVNLTITNPTISGFEPMTLDDPENDPAALPDGGTSQPTITCTYDSLNSDITYSVYYVPGLTHYAARYYLQNLYDDLYTLDHDRTNKNTNRLGKTGTAPSDLESEKITGFTSLFHEPDAIAADGSTVFRVYYDRNYYSVTFDLGEGGYGIEPIFAKYQTVFRVDTPQRSGYSFQGWARTSADSSKGEYGTDWVYISPETVVDDDAEDADGKPCRKYYRNQADFESRTECTLEDVTISKETATDPNRLIQFAEEEHVPAYNSHYQAVWESGTTSFSIVFWLQKPEVTDITPAEITAAGSRVGAQSLIGERYNVVAAKTVTGVTSGTPVNLSTTVQSTNGSTPQMWDFFNFDFRMPENGVTYDFPYMSASMRTELNNNKRYILFNDYLSDLQFHGEFEDGGQHDTIVVAGDGSTRINVYLKRANFSLKFFYAKTTGGTESTDENGYPTLTGNYDIYLTSGTKNFSGNHNDSKSTDLLKRVKCTGWSQKNAVAALPQISAARRSVITPDRVKFLTDGNDRYWYYELPSKYGADLKNTWFNDAFEIMDSTAVSGEHVYFGSWAVEYFSRYRYKDDGSALRGNYTVKGRFEELSGLILYQESEITSRNLDPTQLAFVASWDNTGGQSWNTGQDKVYNFTYKNYIQLLPCHDYIYEAAGAETLIEGGDYQAGTYSKNGLYFPGGHFDAGYYVDIVEFNNTRYGLRASDIIETYDVGDQYANGSNLKTGKDMAKALRDNQTAVKITGCTILDNDSVPYTFNSTHMSGGECVTETVTTTLGQANNPQGIWYDRTDIDDGISHNHHCDVMFFYSRNIYSITYVNITETLNTPSNGRAPFEDPLSIKSLKPVSAPVYPVAGLEDYYVFAGWYKDPFHIQPVDFEHDIIPASEVKFYAKWVPKTIDVIFYSNYNDYYADRKGTKPENRIVLGKDSNNKNITELPTDYGSYIRLMNIPDNGNDPNDPRPKLIPIAEGASFAGWYYIRNRIPMRFEPENVPVTALNEEATGENAKLRLYAEWVTKDVAQYKVRYVKQSDTSVEVAHPMTGRAYVWKTKTFNAKSGDELNDEYKWSQEGEDAGTNWWPTANSSSIVIKANDSADNEYSPNELTFYYIQKEKVYYRVQYLDSATRKPLNSEGEDIIRQSSHASVKEDARIIPGYVAQSASLSQTLTASSATDASAQKAEELENNVITFLYDKNENDYLYQVECYTRDLDDAKYSLYASETTMIPINKSGDTTLSLADVYNSAAVKNLESSGYTRVANATDYVVSDASGVQDTEHPVTVADDGSVVITGDNIKTIRIYFSRKSYPYIYQYIDHTAENRYNKLSAEEREGEWNGVIQTIALPENTAPIGAQINLNPETDITVTVQGETRNYTRITNPDGTLNDVSLTIQPDDENAGYNIVKIYYRRDVERELNYQMICVNRTSNTDYADDGTPLFGRLSVTMQTVLEYGGINPVTFYSTNEETTVVGGKDEHLHLHRYTFLGWYSQPERGENDEYLITKNTTLTSKDLSDYYGLNESDLPERDQTKYYALVEQDTVKMDVMFYYTDDYTKDSFYSADDDTVMPIIRSAVDNADNPDVPDNQKVHLTGERVGKTTSFTNPNGFVNHSRIAWHRNDGYTLDLVKIDNRVYKYEFVEWWEIDPTKIDKETGKPELIRHNNWNSEEWDPTNLDRQLARNRDQYLIAVYARREVTSIPYSIEYLFTPRTGGEKKSFTVKGTLTEQQLKEGTEASAINNEGCYELTNDFIMANAPFESNHGKLTTWTDRDNRIVKDSVKGVQKEGTVDRIITTVTALEEDQPVTAFYRLTPDDVFTPINTFIGANRKTDTKLQVLDARDKTYNGKSFSYWEIRKSDKDDSPVIARCYEPWFTYVIWENYFITPVYETDENSEPAVPDSDSFILTALDNSRNQWTDSDGNMLDNAYSDYLYCDFEIAFTDGDAAIYNNPDYKAGLVFEICGKSDGSFDPETTYNTNTDNLKTAIKDILKSSETGGNGKFNNGTDEAPKNRSIQVNPIETSSLTNRSRIEYAKPYRNVYKTTASGKKSYTNGAYIYKVSAYLIKGDTVILSNSVNVCLYDVATKDFASTDMCVYTP